MYGALLVDQVTLRKPASRTGRNEVTYAQVLDSHSQHTFYLRCKLEFRLRRVITRDSKETTIDGTMLYIDEGYPEIQADWLIYTEEGEVYRIREISRDTQIGTGTRMKRAELVLHRQRVLVNEMQEL